MEGSRDPGTVQDALKALVAGLEEPERAELRYLTLKT